MGKKKVKSKRGVWKLLAVIFAVAVVGLYLYIYIVPKVSDSLKDTYTAEYGTLEIGEESEFLIVRTERVHTADNSGAVSRISPQGSLQRINARVVDVGGTGHYNQVRGIISYSTDGLENEYTPDNMDMITPEALIPKQDEDGNKLYEIVKIGSGDVSKGDPIFKVVDNQTWYVIAWLDKDQTDYYPEGKKIYVRFDDSTELIMKVYSASEQKGKLQLILACDRYWDKFSEIRTGKCKIIHTKKDGIIVEQSSIVEQDGIEGVYRVNKLGQNVFTPVKVLAFDGTYTACDKNYFYDKDGNYTETIKNYVTILRPDKMKIEE